MSNTTLMRRFGAMLYDGLLVIAVLFIGTVPFVAVSGGEFVQPQTRPYQLALVLITFVFFVGFWARYGRTLGMQSWDLRIEDASGRPPTLVQCSIRYAAALLSWLPFGLGFFWQLVDRDGLAWHDRLSGTRLRHYPKAR